MIVVAWLRIAAFVGLSCAVSSLAALGHAMLLPWPAARMRFAARCTGWWSRLGCASLRVRIDVDGRTPRGTFVAVANHVSYLDILVLGALFPTVFVAKHEIASWPAFGLVARSGGTLFVDRASARDVVRVGREIDAALACGVSVTLFPEGQATDGREVLPFQPPLLAPAARAAVPCYAIALRYTSPDPTVRPRVDLAWPEGVTLTRHLARLASLRGGVRASVRIAGTPVISDDRKDLARLLHREVTARYVPMES